MSRRSQAQIEHEAGEQVQFQQLHSQAALDHAFETGKRAAEYGQRFAVVQFHDAKLAEQYQRGYASVVA